MSKRLIVIALLILAAVGIWYSFTPDGPIGYDEGTRLADRTAKAAADLQRSAQADSTFIYTPKYGNDQPIHVEFTAGGPCDPDSAECFHSTVVVAVSKGKSGAGYALGESAAVPRHLLIDKPAGPVEIGLAKRDGVVQVVSVR